MPFSPTIPQDLRRWLAFGHGLGIQISGQSLQINLVRVRPNGVKVLGRLSIPDFAQRPAAEWGAEYSAFLKRMGQSHLAATVMLPRRDVIVRQLSLPGVSTGDLDGAIRFQLETLHPYGEDDVVSGWTQVGEGAVLVGIMRRSALARYVASFVEAGIAVASFTFSATAIHAAVRLLGAAPGEGFMAVNHTESGAAEIYGESPVRPVFSAEFDLSPERAAGLAAAELRLHSETAPRPLEDLLPRPLANPIENDISRNPLPYVTALAGACPWLVPSANLLPADYRKTSSRGIYLPTAVLAALLLLCAGGMVVWSHIEDRRYLRRLEAEIARLEPQARRAAALDKEFDRARARARLLDDFRGRTRSDLDALNEFTRLVSPPAWTSGIDLMRDSARLAGEAPQASSLLKIIDSSPLFENSEFSVLSRAANSENFQLRTSREARK